MMRVFRLACAMALALAFPINAGAEANNPLDFQTFTRSSFYAELINRTLSSLPADVFKRCPSLVSQGSEVKILKPVTFGADGFPNGGVWKQTFPVSGCGNDTTLNFYFEATAAEKINTLVGAPGATHATIPLQNDALKYAKIALLAAHIDCAAVNIKDTKFETYGLKSPSMADPGAGQPHRPWWETWTLIGCGHAYDVPIDFMPDDTGTQIIQQGAVVEH